MQLGRLYEVKCEYADEVLKELQITADFSNDSLEKTLSVIALSLNLDYEFNDHRVEWMAGEKRSVH